MYVYTFFYPKTLVSQQIIKNNHFIIILHLQLNDVLVSKQFLLLVGKRNTQQILKQKTSFMFSSSRSIICLEKFEMEENSIIEKNDEKQRYKKTDLSRDRYLGTL